MGLRWREFERRARWIVADEISRSPALKKQKRRAPRDNIARELAGMVLPIYALIMVTLGYGRWASKAIGSASLLAVLVSVPVTLFLASSFLAHLEKAREAIWRVLPLSRQQVFGQRLGTFWKTPVYLAILITMGYLGIFARGEFADGSRAVFFIALQILMVATSALHVAALVFQRHVTLRMLSLTSVLLIAIIPASETAVGVVRDNATLINTFLPAGWVHHAVDSKGWTDWIYFLPIGLLLIAAPESFRRLRARFFGAPFWHEDLVGDLAGPEIDEDNDVLVEADGDAEMARDFLNLEHPREGIIEWAVDKLWPEPDRVTAFFLWPGKRNWSRIWKSCAKFMLICLGLAALAQTLIGWPVLSVCILAVGGMGSLACSPFFSSASGMRNVLDGGSFAPLYSAFPISYDSMRKSFRAPSLARWVAWTLLALGYVLSIAWWVRFSMATAALFGLKLSLLFPALLPVFTAIWIGQNTTTWRLRWVWCFIPLGLLIFAACAAYAVETINLGPESPSWKFEALAWVFIWILSKLTQILHRYIYRRRGLDLSRRLQNAFSS